MPLHKPHMPDAPNVARALKSAAASHREPPVAGEPHGCSTWSEISIKSPCGLRQAGVALELSERHGHLRFVSRAHLPELIEVDIPRLGVHVPARITRQQGTEVFVEFLTPLDDPCGHLGA